MLRHCLCLPLLVATLAAAAEKKAAPLALTGGTIKEIDADKGTFTLTIKSPRNAKKDMTVKVAEDTKFVAVIANGDRKEFTGKAGLKSRHFKEGTYVEIIKNPRGDVTMVRTGFFLPRTPLPQSKIPEPVAGILKKIDAARKALTLKTKEDGKEVRIVLGKDARFIVIDTKGRQKRYSRTKGFQIKELKEGAQVAVFYGADGKPKAVMTAAFGRKQDKLLD